MLNAKPCLQPSKHRRRKIKRGKIYLRCFKSEWLPPINQSLLGLTSLEDLRSGASGVGFCGYWQVHQRPVWSVHSSHVRCWVWCCRRRSGLLVVDHRGCCFGCMYSLLLVEYDCGRLMLGCIDVGAWWHDWDLLALSTAEAYHWPWLHKLCNYVLGIGIFDILHGVVLKKTNLVDGL